MRTLIDAIVEFLGIKKKIEIRILTKSKADFAAEYEPIYSDSGRLVKHLIWIYLDDHETRSTNTLIAHELIHAWQEELKLDEIHGEKFIFAAEELEYYLAEYHDIRLPGIYDPYIDGED